MLQKREEKKTGLSTDHQCVRGDLVKGGPLLYAVLMSRFYFWPQKNLSVSSVLSSLIQLYFWLVVMTFMKCRFYGYIFCFWHFCLLLDRWQLKVRKRNKATHWYICLSIHLKNELTKS